MRFFKRLLAPIIFVLLVLHSSIQIVYFTVTGKKNHVCDWLANFGEKFIKWSDK